MILSMMTSTTKMTVTVTEREPYFRFLLSFGCFAVLF